MLKQSGDSVENHFIKHLRSIKQQIDKQNAHKDELQDEKTQEKILNQDSQKILKIRLKRIIANNKEKLKVLDDYIRKMQNIDEQFGKIKEFSGIQDLNDIADTFIKSDQQNYQLYNYIDSLNQEIDHMREENQALELRIVQQQVLRLIILSEATNRRRAHRLRKHLQGGAPAAEDLPEDRGAVKPLCRHQIIRDFQDTLKKTQPIFYVPL